MFFHIDYNSSQPIYQQVIEQIKFTIVNGGLKPGERMLSIRELAKTLKINPTTAAKIYNELAHEGVLVLRQGQGAFVAPKVVSLASEEIQRIVAEHTLENYRERSRLAKKLLAGEIKPDDLLAGQTAYVWNGKNYVPEVAASGNR